MKAEQKSYCMLELVGKARQAVCWLAWSGRLRTDPWARAALSASSMETGSNSDAIHGQRGAKKSRWREGEWRYGGRS